jgi:hypothetical protein
MTLQVLEYHIIEGAVLSDDLSDGMTVMTVGGIEVTVSISNDTISFTGPDGGSMAEVVEADILSCAGVVHLIDAVILPGDSLIDAEAPGFVTGNRSGPGDDGSSAMHAAVGATVAALATAAMLL